MLIMFRQGIINYPRSGNTQRFLTRVGNNINLVVDNDDVLTYTIAHRDSNYFLTETVPVTNAWTHIPANEKRWLYIDINLESGVRTFGNTNVQPISSLNEPPHEQGLMWYDTTRFTHYVSELGQWREVLRIIIAVCDNQQFLPYNINTNGMYAGTQIGDVGNIAADAGRIIFDESGSPIHRVTGELFTSSTKSFTTTSLVNPLSLETTILEAMAQQSVDRFQVVKFTNFGEVLPAKFNDIQTTVIGITTEAATVGTVVAIQAQGIITNPDWAWSKVGVPLWVDDTGRLTERNLHEFDIIVHPEQKAPVARVISRTQVYFDQGLGAKGDRGPVNPTSNVRMMSPNEAGIAYLSVPADNANFPIVVGDNDPRLTGPRPPTAHNHPATDIIPLPVGDLIGSNLQDVLSIINDKLALVGYDMMITDLTFNQINNVLTIRTNYPDANRFDVDLTYLATHVDDMKFNPTNRRLTTKLTNGVEFVTDLSSLVPIARTDSTSIALSGNGDTSTPLKADLRLDPTLSNMAKVNSTGLMVTPPATGSVAIVTNETPTVNLTGNGTVGSPLMAIVKPNSVSIAVANTNTANISGSGTATSPIKVDARVSVDAANMLTSTSTGLTAAVNSTDSQSIELTGSGSAGSRLTANLKVSTATNNILQTSANGVAAVIAKGTSSSATLSGLGTTISPLAVSVRVNSDADNILESTSSGLKVSVSNISTAVSHVDSSSIKLTGAGTNLNRLQATAIIDPAADNLLIARSTGLYAPKSTYGNGLDGQFLKWQGSSATWTYLDTIDKVNVANTATLNLSGDGTVANRLQGVVRVSADNTNALTISPDGLYVAEAVTPFIPGTGRVTPSVYNQITDSSGDWIDMSALYTVSGNGTTTPYKAVPKQNIDVVTSSMDVTANRVTTVGWLGMGSSYLVSNATTNLGSLPSGTNAYISASHPSRPTGTSEVGSLSIRGSNTAKIVEFVGTVTRRMFVSSDGGTNWTEMVSASNIGANLPTTASRWPTWAEVSNKPTTFAPIIGNTATTAKAGNWLPTWNDVQNKPATFVGELTGAVVEFGLVATSGGGHSQLEWIADLPAGYVLTGMRTVHSGGSDYFSLYPRGKKLEMRLV